MGIKVSKLRKCDSSRKSHGQLQGDNQEAECFEARGTGLDHAVFNRM